MKVVIDTLKREGAARRLHRARRRRAAQRGVRQGGRRRRLLPRRRGRRRDRQAAASAPARPRLAAEPPGPSVRRLTWRRAARHRAAARWPASCAPCSPGRARRRRGALPAGQPAQPPRAHRPGVARACVDDDGRRARTVFVAYADCGTGGALDAFLAEHPAIERLPGAHCYEFFAGSRALRRAARRRARHVLPDRLPGQALRRAGVAGARPRPPSRAAADVLRQLPPARAAVAARRPAVVDAGRGRGRTARARVRARAHRARDRSPPPSPSASPAGSR